MARWEVDTDPLIFQQQHLTRAPYGIDAYAAWQVPGGGGSGARVADAEFAWDLTHPDLVHAGVTVLTPFAAFAFRQKDIDHGTESLGIVGAWTDGSVSTGIAPFADLTVSSNVVGAATAILRAARHVGRGGIVLLELGVQLNPNVDTGEVPLEHDPLIRDAIVLATALGVLVIEPAGNGNINLDTDARFIGIRPSPGVPDSGALVVAACMSVVR